MHRTSRQKYTIKASWHSQVLLGAIKIDSFLGVANQQAIPWYLYFHPLVFAPNFHISLRMANLRQRNVSLANDDGKSEPIANAVGPKSSTRPSYRAHILLTSVILLSTFFLLYNKQQQQQLPLPVSYVLCSRAGNRIYTVDDTGTQVQCLAVHNSQIVAIGSLGEVFTTMPLYRRTHRLFR